ncbi:MAG: VCBS repeat-containing protein [Reichenbachiella sp.]
MLYAEEFGGMKLRSIIILMLISFFAKGQQFEERHFSWLDDLQGNNALSVADYDQDGDLDLIVVERIDAPNQLGISRTRLFQNQNNGSFEERTNESGIQTSSLEYDQVEDAFGNNKGAAWGDYNNDGFPDLFLTSFNRLILYKNSQDGTFQNVTSLAGFAESDTCNNAGAAWFDYNNDGFLDVFITKFAGCSGNRLFKNNGNETFSDVSLSSGISGSYPSSWMMMPIDVNNDNYQDIYVSNDFGEPNELFVNQKDGTFINQSESYDVQDLGQESMGMDLGDVDQDGDIDIFLTNINRNKMYINQMSIFEDDAISINIQKTGWAWGAKFFDFDLDSDQDLLVVNGHREFHETNLLYQRSDEQLLFEEVGIDNGFDRVNTSFVCEVFDYDNDGDLDVLMGDIYEGPQFLENITLSATNQNTNWIQIELVGVTSNRDAIGALVTVYNGDEEIMLSNHTVGFMTQSLRPLHTGLGKASNSIDIVVKWPNGLTESYFNVHVNQFVKITEGDGLESLNRIPSVKILGCMDPNSCNYNSEATIDNQSCEYLSTPVIQGPDTASPLQKSIFSINDGSEYNWQWECVNCSIISGQGTERVEVKWNVSENGEVSVTKIGECESLTATKQIHLEIDINSDDHSVARLWNEVLLDAIRNDLARPTVHARNLFHTSIAMYDAWASMDEVAVPFYLGNQWGNSNLQFEGFTSDNIIQDRNEAISYAAYRLLSYRFKNSPGASQSLAHFDELMNMLDYDTEKHSVNYSTGNAFALGNYIAEGLIRFGILDGANELNGFSNRYYQPLNSPLNPFEDELVELEDPNRWQPLEIEGFIDQSGNPQKGDASDFLTPEWGLVQPFALTSNNLINQERNGSTYSVYEDPGAPPFLNLTGTSEENNNYQWGFSMVSIWGAHLDPTDGVMWDISPGNVGNLNSLPDEFENYSSFYNYQAGGDIGKGRSVNPISQQNYAANVVPRGDFTRVLAEFWADGPDSETPPGHWFSILNYVSDHASFERKFEGLGSELDPLEWDVKAYFSLGGAMHDAAISAWSIKGWYDYVRPLSAIRFMSQLGQSSNANLDNYHTAGIPLVSRYVEVIEEGDPLEGENQEHLGKIKLYSWKGHDYIENPESEVAGVGWILASDWWPYQRPSFVTPPFAGYVSGHSTFSRAAAEVLTSITGNEYFPGGMASFLAKKDEFLVFEKGPSVDVLLQWATYRDAADQCSMSRIWGGIHPPADDIPGRKLGEKVGLGAFNLAKRYFSDRLLNTASKTEKSNYLYPNPVNSGDALYVPFHQNEKVAIYNLMGQRIVELEGILVARQTLQVSTRRLKTGQYFVQSGNKVYRVIVK